MKGMALIVSGPSGVGKDTVIDAWTKADNTIARVVATTTRKPRENEVDGVDYNFVSKEEFESLIDKNAFLEYMNVHGNYYGTPLSSVDKLVLEGKTAILKIDVQGALEVMKKRADIPSIFILPPSLEELENRLRGRGTEKEEVIQKRLKNALDEIEKSLYYQYKVINKDVEITVTELQEIKKELCQKSS